MDETRFVYGAFLSGPVGSDHPPSLLSLHKTFEGAKKALYPNKDYEFKPSSYLSDSWNGPDGCGLIMLLEIQQ